MGPLAWLALAGVNAALSASKASQAAKQRKMEADLRAAEIEASPWTGKAPSTQISTPTPNIWGELAGAGINTIGQGAALQGSGLFSEAPAQAASSSAPLSGEDFEVGGMNTRFGTIGATKLPMDEMTKQSIGFFNAPYSSLSWKSMVPTIYGDR